MANVPNELQRMLARRKQMADGVDEDDAPPPVANTRMSMPVNMARPKLSDDGGAPQGKRTSLPVGAMRPQLGKDAGGEADSTAKSDAADEAAAAEARRAAAQEAGPRRSNALDKQVQLASELEEVRAELSALRVEHEKVLAETQAGKGHKQNAARLGEELDELKKEISTLRQDKEAVERQLAATRQTLQTRTEEKQRVESELEAATTERDTLQQTLHKVRSEGVTGFGGKFEEAQKEAEGLRDWCRQLQADLKAAQDELEEVSKKAGGAAAAEGGDDEEDATAETAPDAADGTSKAGDGAPVDQAIEQLEKSLAEAGSYSAQLEEEQKRRREAIAGLLQEGKAQPADG